jgi:hypothetical protein
VEFPVGGGGAGVEETGQTVVYKEIVSVTTSVDRAGQLVTVGAQDVLVYVFVV